MRIFSALALTAIVSGFQANAAFLNLGFDRKGDRRGVKAFIRNASVHPTEVMLYADEEVNGKFENVQCAIPTKVLAQQGLDAIALIRLAVDSNGNAEISCWGKVNPYAQEASQTLRIDAETVYINIIAKK